VTLAHTDVPAALSPFSYVALFAAVLGAPALRAYARTV
jgi:hypothetical protein